jgi:hypothetical protein
MAVVPSVEARICLQSLGVENPAQGFPGVRTLRENTECQTTNAVPLQLGSIS